MGEKLVVGPVNKGLRTDRLPFVIDNDSFPVLINAYQWRGRVKRKRGTSLLNRLTRYFNSSSTAYSSTSTITLDGSGNGNILTGFSLQTNGNIVPGSVTLVGASGPTTYTDPSMDGTLSPTGTINYATGDITIAAQAAQTVSAVFRYYPDLPVMGLRDLVQSSSQFYGTLGFDTVYAYNILPTSPYNVYDVSFYKNPASTTINGIAYTEKTTVTPTSWNGQTYQQFWTTNYQGALWATNGINVPFSVTNIGMQYKACASITYVSATELTITITEASASLVVGDWVFINEVTAAGGTADASTINFQTGFVTASANAAGTTTLTVRFPYATIAASGGGSYSAGILQYLTSRSDTTKDCLRWYDGDPTDGNATTPTLNGHKGWVNFCPPISQGDFSIADLPADQYYLVGCRTLLQFKDRILFFGPVVQTSASGSQIYLQDTIIYSQNGTPYYTASFTGDVSLATTTFNPLLVPTNQTATANSFFSDRTGFGGFISAGLDQPIITVAPNEDVLIVGFSGLQTRLVYTGNDLVPFNFFVINVEYGSASTFSVIDMGSGVLSKSGRGFIITSQVDNRRIDLDILDQVFEVSLTNNGAERVTAQRDYISEWIYFTYPSNKVTYSYPNQTLQYNYRDNSWAIFNECYTSYGLFRKQTGYTWGTIGTIYPTWSSWNDPWSSGASTLLNPEVIGGNQQGFVLVRNDGTNEGNSLYIQNVSGNTVTSPNHCLNNGDYIIISGCLGVSNINGNIYSVQQAATNTFVLNGPTPAPSGTYLGGGVIKRMYVPFVQTKQFPTAWGFGRKTRIGPQQYLLTTTANGQITLLIYLSQDADNAYNSGAIVPSPNTPNNALIYSTVLYTCPESANLGLTPANTNLQMISLINPAGTDASSPQAQIWHRMNTSLIGDTVQLGFTMSDSQMRDTNFKNQFSEIELHAFVIDTSPSQMLS